MKKKKVSSSVAKSSDSTTFPDYEEYIAVNGSVAKVTVRTVGTYNLHDNVLFKPMAYLKHNPEGIGYSFYAFIVVPANSFVHSCHIQQINSTNFIILIVGQLESQAQSEDEIILFMEVTNMPAPVGFKISSVDLTVTTDIPVAGPPTVPQMGKGKVAVDYQDADESI